MSRYAEDARPSRGRDREEAPRRSRGDDDRPAARGRGRDDDDDRGSRRGGGRFEYAARDAASAKKRGEASGGDFDKYLNESLKMWKPNDGANTIRILPPTWKKPEHYGHDIYVHYGVGPDRQTYLCLHKMKGEKCPICEERAEAERNGDEKYAKELKPRQRVLVYIVDRDHEKDGVQAWAAPWTFDRDLAKVSTDRRTGAVLLIDHPEEGYDVEFDKKGAKDRTEYLGISVARRESPLGNDKWLDFAVDNPLPEQLQYFEYDHIAKAFGGGGSSKSRGRDDDDDRDSGRRGRSTSEEQAEPRRNARRDEEARSDRSDRSGGRSSRDADEEALTWDQVHEMTSSELDDLVEVRNLEVNPNKFDSDEDLADAICEELSISKVAKRRGRDDEPAARGGGRGDDDAGDDRDRLAKMRRGRDDDEDDRPAPRRRGD